MFFAAGSAERRLILLNLEYAEWPAGEPPAPLQRADVWRLETAALRHHTATLMRELERALGISYQQSRRIVEDEMGEPIVVAAKAMCLPADILQRIVLFMNPRVGQSVDRVYELSALYNEISVECRAPPGRDPARGGAGGQHDPGHALDLRRRGNRAAGAVGCRRDRGTEAGDRAAPGRRCR